MKFNYIASQQNGKVVEGEMEAASAAEVLAFLAGQGLKPVSLKKQDVVLTARKRFLSGSIDIADKIFITKYLSLMLKIGTDLFKAIDILINDFEKPSVRLFLLEIRANLEKGQPFYLAFAKYPKYFSETFVNLIKAGEASGTLEKVFEKLSDTLQKEQELRSEIRAALIYPILLVATSIIVVFVLISFALPRISKVFSSSAIKPPLFSQIVFAIGDFLNKYSVFFIVGAVLFAGTFWFLSTRNVFFRKLMHRLSRRLPLVGKVLKILAVQRFCSSFSSLLASGLPIVESLEITAKSVGDEDMKVAIIRVAREGISKGLTVGEAFRKEAIFPRTVTNLIAVSEKSGHIENILATLGDFYESEARFSIKGLVAVLEPVLLLAIGLIIGTIALAVIVPVYQLVGNI